MNLLDSFSQTFEALEESPLKHLLKSVNIYDFDQQKPSTEDLAGMVGVGNSIDTATFMKAFVDNSLNYVVQTNNDDLLYELFIAGIILKKPKLFLNNPVTILNSQENSLTPMRMWAENFNCTDHKGKILDGVDKFLSESKPLNRLKENVAIIIDELFSNALFNGPADDNGYPIFKNMARNEKIRFPGNKNAKIFLVHSRNDLFVGCIDPFGSINRKRFVKVIEQAYSVGKVRKDDELDGGKGAGFGMRMMLDRSRSLYVLSEKGKRSLVVCHMRLNISLKKVETVPKQLHINCF